MNHTDRQQANGMHGVSMGINGVPINFRDASGSSDWPVGPKSAWRQAPTAVPVPKNGQREPGHIHRSPYARTIESTLRQSVRPSGSGNLSSQKVLRNLESSRASKRRKPNPEHDTTGDTFQHSRRASVPIRNPNSKGKLRQSLPGQGSQEVISVDSDPEDKGILVSRYFHDDPVDPDTSTDPLNITSRSPSSLSMEPEHTRLLDGDSTQRLRSKRENERSCILVDDDTTDEIQDADDWGNTPALVTDKGLTQDPKQSRVRQLTEKFGGPVSKSGIPHLDLKAVPVRIKMKPNQFPKTIIATSTHGHSDSIATSKSPFFQNIKKSKRKEKHMTLPLQAWSHGCKMYQDEDESEPSPYHIIWDEGLGKMTVRRGPPGTNHSMQKVDFLVEKEFVSFVYCKSDHGTFIQFQSGLQNSAFWKPAVVAYYRQGSQRQDGKVSLKFSLSDGEVVLLIKSLALKVTKWSELMPTAAQKLWESACNSADLYEEEVRRKTDEHAAPISDRDKAPSRPRLRKEPVSTVDQEDHDPLISSSSYISGNAPVLPRRSIRHAASQSRRTSPAIDPEELILVYPPTGTGAVNITRADLQRLAPSEFLNDTLIEFGLKLWLNELREKDPQLADQIHVFSSFFYKKLNNKKLDEGYQSVRKWTSKFDIFQKKYLIVPINEHLHWYLAIIYQPEHVLSPPAPQERRVMSTRLQARQVEEAPLNQEDSPISSLPASGDVTDDPTETRQQSPSAESANVGTLNFESISITPIERFPKPLSSVSSNGNLPNRFSPERIVVDDESELGALAYPSLVSSPPPNDMDVEHLEEAHSRDKPGEASARSSTASEPPTRVIGAAVSPTKFYGSAPGSVSGYKRKADDADIADSTDEMEQEAEVNELLAIPQGSENSNTYIFILDSLNNRHPQANKILKQYLKMEARDKKNIEETTEPVAKQAQVPLQPNYCDCGLYLLHFAKTFMKRPEHYCQLIVEKRSRESKQTERRRADWEADAISTYREELAHQVEQLSEVWKKKRAKREEEKEREADQSASDDDIDIVEDIVMRSAPSLKRGKMKTRQEPVEESAAFRVR